MKQEKTEKTTEKTPRQGTDTPLQEGNLKEEDKDNIEIQVNVNVEKKSMELHPGKKYRIRLHKAAEDVFGDLEDMAKMFFGALDVTLTVGKDGETVRVEEIE